MKTNSELDLTKYEEVQFRDDWHLGLVGSDIRVLLAEVKRLRAKLEAANQLSNRRCSGCRELKGCSWMVGMDSTTERRRVNE